MINLLALTINYGSWWTSEQENACYQLFDGVGFDWQYFKLLSKDSKSNRFDSFLSGVKVGSSVLV